ncbi:DUF5641 domain-containing protein [Caerostris extrusa]|uniref:DUF5641 domain-containing protein n=1 Tax=Caerostris extrusa TaxID=172846 RepID=A0AAV4VMA8_CAEEX|nr:DUF5641 domain-containing protein [Caerostris extrusa]
MVPIFVGADNLLKTLDWDRVFENGTVNCIQWKFNPSTASWWVVDGSERDLDFVPLSLSLFLQDIKKIGLPDWDVADHKSLNRRIQFRLTLQKDLMKRFRV